MKIAVLSSHLPSPTRAKSGGVAYASHRLANALTQRGHRVTVFTTDERPPNASYHVRKVLSPPPPDPLRAWVWSWQLAWRYAAQDFSGFDIIHAHGNNALIRHPGRPLVRTLHGASLGEAIHATTWKRRLWYLTVTPSELWEAARATRVVAVSANTRRYVPGVELVITQFGESPGFLPRSPSEPSSPSSPSRHPLCRHPGRTQAGTDVAGIFSIAQIRPALPDAELWMVAERNVQAPGVTCFQNPSENALADLYRRAWVFCLPSTYEGFGIPYIEAMACGTPVVATPNAGARELLEDGKYGVLARASELGPVLLSLLNDAPKRLSFAQLGLERAEAFAQDRVVDAYEALFASTISSARQPSSGREE